MPLPMQVFDSVWPNTPRKVHLVGTRHEGNTKSCNALRIAARCKPGPTCFRLGGLKMDIFKGKATVVTGATSWEL